MPKIEDRLSEIAPIVQQWLAINREADYSVRQIEQALNFWLERSIDGLIEESLYHCVAGSAVHAVGRCDFQLALHRIDHET